MMEWVISDVDHIDIVKCIVLTLTNKFQSYYKAATFFSEALLSDAYIQSLKIEGYMINMAIVNIHLESDIKCVEGVGKYRDITQYVDVSGKGYYVLDNDKVYEDTRIPLLISWSTENTSPISSTFVCEAPQCQLVKLEPREFVMTDEGLILQISGDNKILLKSQYVTDFNNSVFVCLEVLKDIHMPVKGTQSENNKWVESLQVITVIGGTVSLLSLFYTFLCYSIFSSLRNVSGYAVMSLTFTLFWAQLIFMISNMFLKMRNLCIAIGALQHYLWLSVFFWMNVIAVDTVHLFSILTKEVKKIKFKQYIRYCMYAWGVPLLIVAICLIFAYMEVIPVPYGSDVCWISEFWVLLITFALVILLLVSVNFVFFIMGAYFLHIAAKDISFAQRHFNGKTLLLNVKLAFLMGFTWLFGFLAQIRHLEFLWYALPFVIPCKGYQSC